MRGFVAELSNGEIIKEETIYLSLCQDIKQSSGTLSMRDRPWILLKKYLLQRKNLKLVALHLQYDHQGIFLPRHAKSYFFSRKVEGYLGGTGDRKQYTGVGASETHGDEVIITWFDGEGSVQETRKVDGESDQFITNQ